jgi:hypothetical protein
MQRSGRSGVRVSVCASVRGRACSCMCVRVRVRVSCARMRSLRPVFAAVSMHGNPECNHATTSTCDARGLRSALLACESEINTLLLRVYARICIITVREGGGEVVLRFCRAHASARKAANAHAHAHAICSGNCNAAAAMQLPLRVYTHTSGPILTNGRQRRPFWARGWRRAAAIHPFTRHALFFSRYALRRSHRYSQLPLGVPGSPVAYRIRSISESAACVLRTTGTVSIATSTTRLACLALQRGQTHEALRKF